MVVGIGESGTSDPDAASIVEYTGFDCVCVNDGEVAIIDRDLPLKIVTLDNRENRIDIKQLPSIFGNSKKGAIPTSCSRRSTSSPRPSSIAFAAREPRRFRRAPFGRDRQPASVFSGPAASSSWPAAPRGTLLIGEHLIENICRAAGRGGVRVGVPLPQSDHPSRRHRDRRIAVRRNSRYAGRRGAGRKAGAFVFGICNVWAPPSPGLPIRCLHPTWGRDRRESFDQGFHRSGDRLLDAGPHGGRERGTVSDDYFRESVESAARTAADPYRGAEDRRADSRSVENLHLCP